ncbi:MAG: hypothetical protein IJN85_00510 [Oscillospiraceae bacterium]|nr:hypothetical protein [Oscillospiraceae bacterium]
MKKKKLSLQSLIYDNRVVLVFSIIAAIIIWIVVAIQFSPEDDRVVKEVPVKIDISNNVSNLGLQMFGETEFYVDVTVQGKRYEVAESVLTKDDLVVTAKTNYVDSSGSHTLKLEVNAKNPENMTYEIVSLSENTINVYFDYYKEGEYTLESNIIYNGDSFVPDGYITDTPLLSANTVKLSGPTTEMDKIDRVVASVSLEDILTTTTALEAEIVPLSEFGGKLQYITVDDGTPDITITIPVYKKASMPTTVTFRNVPSAYSGSLPQFACSPAKLNFAMEESALSAITSLSIADIDFYMLDAGVNKIEVDLLTLNGVKVQDNISKAIVTVNIKNASSDTHNISSNNISFINVPAGYRAVATQSGIYNVKVVGPQADLQNIAPTQLFAEVDLSEVDVTKSTGEALARAYVQGSSSCWVYNRYPVSYRLEKIS